MNTQWDTMGGADKKERCSRFSQIPIIVPLKLQLLWNNLKVTCKSHSIDQIIGNVKFCGEIVQILHFAEDV